MKEEKAHVILGDHFFNYVVDVGVKPLHQFINLSELALDSLNQHMRQVLVVISQQSHRLFFCQFQTGHQLIDDVLQEISLGTGQVLRNLVLLIAQH